jgi:hypothetical protein
MAKNYVKINGIKIGDPDPSGWTAEDLASWSGGPAVTCNYVRPLLGKCKSQAMSGNARCSWHQGK